MNDFSKRQQDIILLIENSKQIRGEDISKQLNISVRTVRNEIATINNLYHIIDSSSYGYSLNKNYQKTEGFVTEKAVTELEHLLIRLLKNNNKYNIDELADGLYISRSTLERRFNALVILLQNSDLVLQRKKNHIWIDGSEQEKRRFVSYFFNTEITNGFVNTVNYENYLPGIDIDRIKHITQNTINRYGGKIKDSYANGLFNDIYVSLYRCRHGAHIEKACDNPSSESSNEYRISEEIYKLYCDFWKFTATKNDIIYLSLLLYGRISVPASNNQPTKDLHKKNKKIISAIVKETFKYYKLDISIEKNFISNFTMHVESLIQRCIANQFSHNDILENIKKNYPFIFDVSVMLANKIGENYSIVIPDEEVGFIAIYIGFLIGSFIDHKEKINILLLSSSYHKISLFIKESLHDIYDNSINIYDNIDALKTNNIDLIISNNSVNILGKQVLVVSPFFNTEDRRKIDTAISECLSRKDFLSQQYVLNSFFEERFFFKTTEICNKDDAILFLCRKLEQDQIVKEDYYKSVIKRESLSSTCFFDSFAVPHAYEFLARKTKVAVLINEKGVEWDNTRISIILLFAIKTSDSKIFMKAYNTLIKALLNKQQISELIKTNNVKEFLNVLFQ